MSRAIVAYLWPAQVGVLETYLKRHPGVTVLVPMQAFNAMGRERIAAAGGTLVALESLLEPGETEFIQSEAEQLQQGARLVLSGADWRQHCERQGRDAERFARLVAERAAEDVPAALFLLAALERAHARYDIGVLLVIEDLMPTGRTMTEWARSAGLPSLALSHSLLLFRSFTIHDQVHADVMALYGERALETYRDDGLDPQKFRVVGNPAWDAYATRAAQRTLVRMSLFAQHRLDWDKPLAVFCTTWNANMSALSDAQIYRRTMAAFFRACAQLRDAGLAVQPLVKDRVQNFHLRDTLVPDIAAQHGYPRDTYAYASEGVEDLIIAADVVISVDSNIAVEAMQVQTPAISLVSEFGLHLGPCFGAETGVVECEEDELAGWMRRLLSDDAFREQQCAAMKARAEYYNKGTDGQATQRVVALMEELSLPEKAEAGGGKYIWQSLLDVSESDTNQYHNWTRRELVALFRHPPRLVLDIGCGAAATGAYIKEQYPGVRVVGIEVNRGAVAVAQQRIDQVLAGKFEDIDLDAAGIHKGSIDTVIVADVLEHMYDPWNAMTRLRPYLSDDAQVVASIPNVRNLALMNDMADGFWRYEAWGLLDITHIRFFTLREIHRFFHETGYRVAHVVRNLDRRLMEFYQNNKDKPQLDVSVGRLTLRDVSQDELTELCALQFYVVAEPGRLSEEAFAAEEKNRSGEQDNRPAYQVWREHRDIDTVTARLINERVAQWSSEPRLHLAVVAHPFDPKRLGTTLNSLTAQNYQNLTVTIVTSAPPPAGWNDSATLCWRQSEHDAVLAAVNRALLERPADWVGLVDAGDQLAEHALVLLVEALLSHAGWEVAYSDEDVLRAEGGFDLPHFKPDFNLDLLRSSPYIGALLVCRQEMFRQLGGFDPAWLGAEESDLVLRVHETRGEGAIGHVSDVLYHRSPEGGHCRMVASELVETGRRMVAAHLARSGLNATVEAGLVPASYHVRYLHGSEPLVSMLVAVRDQHENIQRLVETLLSTTDYPNYEILLLDNGSSSDAARTFLNGLSQIGDPRLKVFTLPEAAPLPALHNLLAQQARGEYLLFLHQDAAALHADWLAGLMAHARRPDVGAVAPRLLRADGTVYQGGRVLGMTGVAGKVFANQALDYPGYFGRAHLEQDFSALGGGCFLTGRALFEELGGFDAVQFPARLAEADYCLRLAEKARRCVWTPHVNLLCEGGAESLSWHPASADVAAEEDAFLARWLPRLAHDPAYNANLSLLKGAAFTLETRRPLASRRLPWHPLPRVLAQPADTMGCGEYRIFSPLRSLVAGGKVEGWADMHVLSEVELERLELDALVMQRQVEPHQVEAIARHRKFSRALLVFELDDLITHVPVKSCHHDVMPKNVGEMLKQSLALCDRFVVSTAPLAEAYRELHPDIRVVPNCLEKARWLGFYPLRRQSGKPRVGWAGGIGHAGDLQVIADVVIALAEEVDWVFLGMCPEPLRPYIREYHPAVPLVQYPAKLASLNLDLAIAPLEHHPFNEAKSHLRLLEYGALGYPVVCTDIYPYQGDFPVKRVTNRFEAWVEAIRERIADLDATAREGDALRRHVLANWMMEDNLDVWLKAWLP